MHSMSETVIDDVRADSEHISDVQVVPCAQPHDREVFVVLNPELDTFSVGDAMIEISGNGCLQRFELFVGRDYSSSSPVISWRHPTQQSWDEGTIVR